MIAEEQRQVIIQLINQYNKLNTYDITYLENYLIKNKICLKNLYQSNTFDILIYAINHSAEKNDYNSVKLVNFILCQSQLPTLNYTFHYYNRYQHYCTSDVPLFSAIARNKFKVADLLLKHHADINYRIQGQKWNGMDILQYLCQRDDNYYYFNTKNLQYILSHGYHPKGITPHLIFKLVDDNKDDLLQVIFTHYVFDNDFILKMLYLSKKKVSLSPEQLQTLICQEKGKIPITDTIYEKGVKRRSFNAISVMLDYDGRIPSEIMSVIQKYQVLEKAAGIGYGHFIKKINYDLVYKIIKHEAFHFDGFDLEGIWKVACQTHHEDLLQLLIHRILPSPSLLPLSSSVNQLPTFSSQNIYDNRISFEKMIIEAGKTGNTSMIKMILEALNNHPQSLTLLKSIHFEAILLKIGKTYHLDIMKLLLQTILGWTYNRFLNKYKFNMALIKTYDTPYLTLLINIIIKLDDLCLLRSLLEREELKSTIDINIPDRNHDLPILTVFYSYTKKIYDAVDLEEPSEALSILDYLLKQGAKFNVKNARGVSLLSLALREKMYRFIECLLQQHHLVKKTDLSSAHPLFIAIYHNSLSEVQSILASNFSHSFCITHQEDTEGKAYDMNTDVMDLEVQEGHNSSLPNPMEIDSSSSLYGCGFTPLILSYILNHKKVFQYLLSVSDPNARDSYNNTVLYYALLKKDYKTVKDLIEMNVDVNFDKNQDSALEISLRLTNKKLFFLVLKSPHLHLNKCNDQEETPMITIIKSPAFSEEEKRKMIEGLIQHGGEVNPGPYETISSPLIHAILQNSLSLVKLLIEHGADVNYTDIDGDTPLLCAIQNEAIPIIKLLLDHGALPRLQDRQTNAPLRCAIRRQSLPIVKLLMEYQSMPKSPSRTKRYSFKRYSFHRSSFYGSSLPPIPSPITNLEQNSEFRRSSVNLEEAHRNEEEEQDIHHENSTETPFPTSHRDSAIAIEEEASDESEHILRYAMKEGNSEIVKYLLGHYQHVHFRNKEDYYDFIERLDHYQDSFEIFRYIEQNSGSIFDGNMVREIIREDRLDLLQILVKYHMDLNIRDDHGDTPLANAIKFSKKRIVDYLIQNGASPYSENDQGETIHTINQIYNYKYNRAIYDSIKSMIKLR